MAVESAVLSSEHACSDALRRAFSAWRSAVPAWQLQTARELAIARQRRGFVGNSMLSMRNALVKAHVGGPPVTEVHADEMSAVRRTSPCAAGSALRPGFPGMMQRAVERDARKRQSAAALLEDESIRCRFEAAADVGLAALEARIARISAQAVAADARAEAIAGRHLMLRAGWRPWLRLIQTAHLDGVKAARFHVSSTLERAWRGWREYSRARALQRAEGRCSVQVLVTALSNRNIVLAAWGWWRRALALRQARVQWLQLRTRLRLRVLVMEVWSVAAAAARAARTQREQAASQRAAAHCRQRMLGHAVASWRGALPSMREEAASAALQRQLWQRSWAVLQALESERCAGLDVATRLPLAPVPAADSVAALPRAAVGPIAPAFIEDSVLPSRADATVPLCLSTRAEVSAMAAPLSLPLSSATPATSVGPLAVDYADEASDPIAVLIGRTRAALGAAAAGGIELRATSDPR